MKDIIFLFGRTPKLPSWNFSLVVEEPNVKEEFPMSWSSKFLIASVLLLGAHSLNSQWVRTNPSQDLSNTILDISLGNEILVAVGRSGLLAYHDNDGWTQLPTITTDNMRAVIFTGERFIAVGDRGIILGSDGTNVDKWSIIESRVTVNLSQIKYLKDKLKHL